jgi:hypothetical protein
MLKKANQSVMTNTMALTGPLTHHKTCALHQDISGVCHGVDGSALCFKPQSAQTFTDFFDWNPP